MEPMLRFKADDGSDFPDWEEMTLGDVGSVAMCKRVRHVCANMLRWARRYRRKVEEENADA